MRLFIISNELISNKNDQFYCDNVDLKSIPEEFSKRTEVILVGRHSRKDKTKLININNKNIKKFNNIFSYLYFLIKNFNKNSIYLIISITPYTFLGCILIYLRGTKPFLYLRSDGFKEYEIIMGSIGYYVYSLMFYILSKLCNLIACEKSLLRNNNGEIVYPSEIDTRWFANRSTPNLESPNILYVGRMRTEKGIFSLINIIKSINEKLFLTIATSENYNFNNTENINLVTVEDSIDNLIKVYDECNITILPSFTESYPKVVDESLSRLRPVIIFDEISHILNNRSGIFVCKRSSQELLTLINKIILNYDSICKKILNNNFSTKENFFKKFSTILNI